jgi:hypothetical protein
MEHIHHMLNFWAILVSAVVLWVLGALWFSPALFAKPWVAAVGRQMGEKPKGVVHGMVSSFIGDLLTALVLEHIVVWAHGFSFRHGAFLGFIAWLGFIAAVLYPQRIYEGRSFKYFTIVAGYWLIGLILIGGILARWR